MVVTIWKGEAPQFRLKTLPLSEFSAIVLNFRFANGLGFFGNGKPQTHVYRGNKNQWISKMLEQCWNTLLKLKKWTAPQIFVGLFSGDSVGIRTQDPQLRRLLLYPAELRNRALSQTNKGTCSFVFIWIDGKKELVHFFLLIQRNQASLLALSWRREVDEVNL